MNKDNTIKRRDFIKFTGMAGTVLAVGYYFPAVGKQAKVINMDAADEHGIRLNQFIFIDTGGKVTLVNHRPEMGQGVYQAMPMLLAEELEVDMDKIEVVQGQADEPAFGHQQVGGSSSVRKSWEPSRKMGAAAREMLVMAAAARWGVPAKECRAELGKVHHPATEKSLGYGALVEAASKLEAPKDPVLKPAKEFKVLGKPLPRKDTPLKTNGQAMFGLDMKVPGMLYASVARCPTFQGKVKDFDPAPALAIQGVKQVVKSEMPVFSHTREGVAVIADSYWAALQGRKALAITWDNAPYDQVSQASLMKRYHQAAGQEEGKAVHTHGNFGKAYQKTAQRLEVVYECPFQAHAPMEPMNATVHVKADGCVFWGPSQSPNWIRRELAKYLDISQDKVEINISFLGGGFGRRAFTDFVLEAAFLSKKAGAPVKVVWTREDDTTQGPFRPAAVYAMKAGFDKEGNTVAMENKIVTQILGHQFPNANKSKISGSTKEGINEDYAIPNYTISAVPQELHIPVMWWRSVYCSTNSFASESFMDEVAGALGKDPMAYRLELLKDSPRKTALLKAVAELSGWDEPSKKGEGKGLAIVESFGSICAQVVKVRREEGKLKVTHVYSAIDCGMTVNPDTIEAQVEGSIIMGLTAAYKGEITFDKGQAVEQNFDTFKMMRIHECPVMETTIMQNEEAPGGVGEPGLPPTAPALANAIFAESGKRIRKLPFNLEEA